MVESMVYNLDYNGIADVSKESVLESIEVVNEWEDEKCAGIPPDSLHKRIIPAHSMVESIIFEQPETL